MPTENKEKDVRYLNKDFNSLKEDLEKFIQVYYPDTYNDFSDSSIGNIFVELSAYVGDVLSYYNDAQFKESLIQYAEERENVFDLAKALGYRPKVTAPASTVLDVFIILPAKKLTVNDNLTVYNEEKEIGDIVPDLSFAPIVEDGMVVRSDSSGDVKFRTLNEIDFGVDRFDSPVDVRIYETDENGDPSSFLIKKQVEAVAGSVTTERFNFGDPVRFDSRTISRDDVIEIINVRDSDGNEWREVPYLAQETVFEEFRNTQELDPELAQDENVRYVLDTIRTPRRFTKRVQSDGTTTLQFGSGISKNPNESIVPSADTIGDPTARPIDRLEAPIDPSNFVSIGSYGQVPYDTTLEVTYSHGGGIESNVPINDLVNVESVSFDIDNLSGLDPVKVQNVRDSIAVINKEPATGGGSGETTEQIRQNATAFFSAQDRAVTKEDYIVRSLSMPSRYGSVAKVFVTQDEVGNRGDFEDNPLGVNLYALGYDNQQNLTTLSDTVKHNLKTYLSQYRMLTDGVNIKDGYVVNLQVEADIVIFQTFNKREVLVGVLQEIRDYFNIEETSFNQPVIIGEIINEINKVQGVQNVADIRIKNVYNEEDGYSGNIYDIESATKDGIIYPSLDPSIFEVRFPNKDIKVRAV